jgi:hypothetical protein
VFDLVDNMLSLSSEDSSDFTLIVGLSSFD